MKKIREKLDVYLNNLKIKRKIFLLYFYCVILPLVLTDTVICGMFIHDEAEAREASENVFFDFHGEELSKELVSIYGRDPEMYSLSERPGFLRLHAGNHHVGETEKSTYLGVRQMDYAFTASVGMEFEPEDSHSGAGFLLFQNRRNFLRAEIRNENQNPTISVIENIDGQEQIRNMISIGEGLVEILFQAEEQLGRVFIVQNGETRIAAENIDLRPYSTEYAGGFVGCTMGMYASAYGRENKDYADVAWFAVRK